MYLVFCRSCSSFCCRRLARRFDDFRQRARWPLSHLCWWPSLAFIRSLLASVWFVHTRQRCLSPLRACAVISSYHHIRISSYHHIITSIIPSYHHIIMSSDQLVIISSYHHIIISSHHLIITSSHHHVITSSCHHITISSYHHVITSSYHHIIISSSSYHHIIICHHGRVPTALLLSVAGDHFGMVGQIMFTKESDVEVALSQFTSGEAAQRARQERSEAPSRYPRPKL